MSWVVTAAAVVAKYPSESGEGYFYHGDLLPNSVTAGEIERLSSMGMIEQKIDERVLVAAAVKK